MIELAHLVKRFGDLVAVNGIDLIVPRGEFFAMLGPNAAGKTTTLKIIAGLIKPSAGTARVAGYDVQTQPLEARRRLAYVPDFPFLYDKLTPWEFFRFTGQLFQMEEDRLQKSGDELIAQFNLESDLDKPIEGLSDGTRQRVAIVSALLHDPEVFVIDEPMVGLDPHHARVVKDILKERSLQGMTVLVSTHQLSVAEEMADRIGIIHVGRLIAVGTREDLRRQRRRRRARAILALTAQEANVRRNEPRGLNPDSGPGPPNSRKNATDNPAMPSSLNHSPRQSPLLLLVRINLLQAWRRVKSVREQSRLLSSLIGLFVVGYLVLSFWLFYRGMKFVETFPGLGTLLTERLLFLLFAFLFVLLLFSNLVISYTNLFRNRETSFLLALPVPAQTIFRWKFLESTLLASWAFLFLIAPLLAAYGLTHRVPWHFYPATLLFTALFVVLPAVAGSWFAVNLARYMDRRVFQVTLLATGALLLAGAAWWLKPEPITDDMLETRVLAVLDRLLMKTRFAQFPLLPSY